MMNVQTRIETLTALGQKLQQPDEYLEAIIHRTQYHNPWFTAPNQRRAIGAIAEQMLHPAKLRVWAGQYDLPEWAQPPVVGLVMAGNIPLVGWHDVLCAFVAGYKAQIKLSEKDPWLLPYFLKLLQQIDARSAEYFEVVEQLRNFDCVIATGSNNTARYFETYFARWPHIIRRNRNGVAVLTGQETMDELLQLGEDIFAYFGLGCRNVSKIYVPAGYAFEPLLEALHEYRHIVLHDKYKHNYDYNFALYTLNRTPFLMAGSALLLEHPAFQSRIAALHYSFYSDLQTLKTELIACQDQIQCVVSQVDFDGIRTLRFGQTQQPELWDYPDGVDTMQFLCALANTKTA